MKVHEALSAVMADVQSVGKGDVNKQQGWSFRGVDAVVNAVGPVLRKHGVCVIPNVTASHRRDFTTKNGGVAHECVVDVEYTIVGPEGDTLTGSSVGESADHGDKGTAQAMSVAYRTWWLQLLCIPTDEPDQDSKIVERAAETPSITAQTRLLAAVREAYPEWKKDDDHRAEARALWDRHGADPKNLDAMLAELVVAK